MQAPSGDAIKFAPLEVQPERVIPEKPAPKVNPWVQAAMKNDTGLKFQPIQLSEQEKKLQGGRQEQEFVFVSKKDMEERRKKREEAANSKPTTL